MGKIPVLLAFSLALVIGLIGFSIGYSFTPEYSLSMYDKNQMDLGMPDKWLDLRYINAMISHHRGAILLANQMQGGEHKFELLSLKNEILKNEPILIQELYDLKKKLYNDDRIVADPVVSMLGSTDKTFDLRFLNALITHHESGIKMTREVKTKTSTSEILDNADAVENFLTESGDQLKKWRSEWFAL